MAPGAVLTRVAATTPARPARPITAPTHAGPVPTGAASSLCSTGTGAGGTTVETAGRSTLTSTEAMPRMAEPGPPPQATTVSLGRLAATPATSKRRKNSTSAFGGSTTWKSFSASPTKSSTRVSPAAADARPRTVT